MNDGLQQDAAARRGALDVRVSCIVRAPAGSGKTELLTQRYLALLATVDEPEEIVAITFTRKAAGEMRERIVQALDSARGPAPEKEHKRSTWELARRAADRDAERDWRLGLHPARMRIQTIDSLDAELTRQMPLLSGFGAPLRINERPLELYEEAASRSLRMLDEGEVPHAAAVEGLARHLDNDLPRIYRLLARMLARRDQWLRHVGSTREALEAGLRREVDTHLKLAAAALPRDCQAELVSLAAHAAGVLRSTGSKSGIIACLDLKNLPAADTTGLAAWRGIADLLLTDRGQWRQALNKNHGFPPEDQAAKARATELIRRLSADEDLRAQLAAVALLPEPHYGDVQWRSLEALLQLLPLATAQLRLVFAERGEVDFAEVALAALRALGEPEAPTDLALALDYRLRHLLVDEFQDTSVNQYRLLEMLTAGWQAGDGRTLFLVGDPAQSIYRFREAEVGLFLRAWQQGLGTVPLKALQLSANFRSRPALVEWCNQAFPRLFPAQADVASGAVPYGAAVARREAVMGTAVNVHALTGEDAHQAEADTIAGLIEAARRKRPEARIAVLARAKSHLAATAATLRERGLHFQAVEIDALGARSVVQDLLALTRALSHPGDRSAWLAALRAPWCGLTLVELHALAGMDHRSTLPALMQAADGLAASNPRFAHTRQVLSQALSQRGRGSLREQVEHAWLQLGGPAAVASEEALADAEAYLSLLEELDEGGELPSVSDLERRLSLLFARPDPQADGSLQLMTIHKAKGLEFDVVILPGLDAATRGADLDLMLWLERPRTEGGTDLLLAPLDAPGQERDALYQWVRVLRREQERLETTRVLYVAVTRAREELHLLGSVDVEEQEGRPVTVAPKPGSLLALLWPVVGSDFETAVSGAGSSVTAAAAVAVPQFTRLKADWRIPTPGTPVQWRGSTVLAADDTDLEFEWVGETLRHVGTVVHRLLQRIAEDGLGRWDGAQRRRVTPLVRQLLAQAGVREEELGSALADTLQAVDNTLADERGRWLLDGSHAEARCEYGLSLMQDGRLESGVIDRTFVDAEGVRWIVDYKTSRHSGTDVDAFLERERLRYAPQLERYAFLIRGLGAPRVKVALYFPLLQRFVSWEPAHGAEP
jgi:ATP-dependent exoDNAse (exonuclease V) beta subunit